MGNKETSPPSKVYHDELRHISSGYRLHTCLEEGLIATSLLAEPTSSPLHAASPCLPPRSQATIPLLSRARARLDSTRASSQTGSGIVSAVRIPCVPHSSNGQQATAIHDSQLHSSRSRKKDRTREDGFTHARSRRKTAANSSSGRKMQPQGRWVQS